MSSRRVVIPCLLALALAGAPLAADHHEAAAAEMATASPGAAYERNLDFVGDRAVQLAEAIPAASYGWRPMEGVRSVGEAINHITGANYFFAGRMGAPAPEGMDREAIDKMTDKAEIVAALERSLAHLGEAFAAVADPAAEVDIFGRQGTIEDMMLIAIGHVHEHFGQLIAYARSNRVVPPWSQGGDG